MPGKENQMHITPMVYVHNLIRKNGIAVQMQYNNKYIVDSFNKDIHHNRGSVSALQNALKLSNAQET